MTERKTPMSNPVRTLTVKIEGGFYLIVFTDVQTAFVYPLTFNGSVPTVDQPVHPLSPIRREVMATARASGAWRLEP
jgi:hypothetical protein